MKKILVFLSSIILMSCSDDYDDSKLWNSINGLEDRVAKLEELCKQMNTNISSLQEIVTALQNSETIKSVSSLTDGTGYLITFSTGKTITIYHGKNGTDGEDGKDGQHGTDGVTPTISVKKDTDGIYYWTVNGDWLLDDGKKVKAEGTDGADGQPGTDGNDGVDGINGITPQFKIENGYWFISYDNKQTWTQLGKATADSGLNGTDGDNFFKGVSIEDGFVCFILNDAESTVIKLPFVTDKELIVNVTTPGTLSSLLTIEQKRSVIQLKVMGFINEEDIKTIRNQLMVLEVLDLTETDITILPEDAFCYPGRSHGKLSLRKIILPNSCAEIGEYSFYGCFNLEEVYAPMVSKINSYAFWYCENIQELTINGRQEHVGGYPGINRPIQKLVISNLSTIASIPDWDYYHLYLPKTITELYGYTCDCLKSITFEEGYNCRTIPNLNGTHIEQIEFPENSADFPGNTDGYYFSNCPYLKTVVIPENWIGTRLPQYAFRKCPRLQTFICKKLIPLTIQYSTTFEDTTIYACNLYVPAESINLYRTAKGWKDFGTILPLEE